MRIAHPSVCQEQVDLMIEGGLERKAEVDPPRSPQRIGRDLDSRLLPDLSNGSLTLRLSRLDLAAESVELPLAESAFLSSQENAPCVRIHDVAERDNLQDDLPLKPFGGDLTPCCEAAGAIGRIGGRRVWREVRVARTLIAGGHAVTETGVKRSDLLIEDATILDMGEGLEGPVDRTIDASGQLILPGAIDVHVHPVYLDDLGACSIAAAHGGITTLMHFAYAKPGESLLGTVRSFREQGESGSVLDFALHGGIFEASRQADEIPAVLQEGVTSFKMFMTYAKLGWMTDDYQLMRVFDILGELGGMGMVHAENGLATDYLQDKFRAIGRDPVEAFVDTRPAVLEAEAVTRAIGMAQVAGCPIYIPHVSARVACDAVALAKAQGCHVFGETCPQYLSLTNEDLQRQKALLKIGPPLRTDDDRRSLWAGLADGTLDTVASDHAPKAKSLGDDFDAAPYGSPQIETMLALVLSQATRGGALSLARVVQAMSENPARIFGLYPRKGTLRPGSDADLVLWDPDAEWTIEAARHHSNAGYSAYEGMRVVGRPTLTMQRGEVIVEAGELRATPGQGEFVRTDTAKGAALPTPADSNP